MAGSLENIKKEADMLQLRLQNGLINTKELESFLVRVKGLPSPNDRTNRVIKNDSRVMKALEMLDRRQVKHK